MNFNKTFSFILLLIFWIGVFPSIVSAQRKFEFGIRFDPLIMPVNFGTFIEDGPGYYDIKAKGKIAQAAYLDFTYWPLQHWGISVGAGVHNFESQIEFHIPDPYSEENSDTVLYRNDQIKAVGLGPSIALQYRNKRFRAKLGLSIFDLSKQEYPVRSDIYATSVFDGTGVLAQVQIEEESFFYTYITEYHLLQLNASYEVLKNLLIKIGFESTFEKEYYYLYTTKITGFTASMPPQNQLLNDFKMSNAYSAFSVGVEYVIGFGKYKKREIEE
jgi:hypothetical protein